MAIRARQLHLNAHSLPEFIPPLPSLRSFPDSSLPPGRGEVRWGVRGRVPAPPVARAPDRPHHSPLPPSAATHAGSPRTTLNNPEQIRTNPNIAERSDQIGAPSRIAFEHPEKNKPEHRRRTHAASRRPAGTAEYAVRVNMPKPNPGNTAEARTRPPQQPQRQLPLSTANNTAMPVQSRTAPRTQPSATERRSRTTLNKSEQTRTNPNKSERRRTPRPDRSTLRIIPERPQKSEPEHRHLRSRHPSPRPRPQRRDVRRGVRGRVPTPPAVRAPIVHTTLPRTTLNKSEQTRTSPNAAEQPDQIGAPSESLPSAPKKRTRTPSSSLAASLPPSSRPSHNPEFRCVTDNPTR